MFSVLSSALFRSRYYTLKSNKDAAMTAMPAKTQFVTNLSFGSYFNAVGTNSLKDMYTIIPPTMPKSVPYALADMLLPCKIK